MSGAIESSPISIKREVIDLTEDDHERPRRSLPWQASGGGVFGSTMSKASPVKGVPMSSPIPVPSVQPPPLQDMSLGKSSPRPGTNKKRPYSKASTTITAPSSPSVPPPPFKNPFERYNGVKTPSAPSTAAAGTPKMSHPQQSDNPRQTQLKDRWSSDKHSPFRQFERDYKTITPGKGNAFAKKKNSPKVASSPLSVNVKDGHGWVHDPSKLYL